MLKHVMQACFTALLRTFCERLKREYGHDRRLGDKITQVEHFCAEVGQHLLVRPHNARYVSLLCSLLRVMLGFLLSFSINP